MNQLLRMTALLLRRLRIDLRGAPGHLLRLCSAVIVLMTIMTSIGIMFLTGAPGLMAFRSLIFADALIISAASTTVFASAIGSERENGTLALLRMTGITSLSVLLGLGASGLIIGVLLLAVQFPFVVLTTTLGGVVWNDVLAAFLALIAHLILCAGLGLFWSALCQRSGTAAFATLVSMLGLWLGPWAARWLATNMLSAGTISTLTEQIVGIVAGWLDGQLVWTRLEGISSSLGATSLWSTQLVTSTAAGMALFLLAVLIMDRRPVELAHRPSFLATLGRSKRGRPWATRPIVWKDFRTFMGGERGLIIRGVVYPVVPLTCAWLLDAFADARLHNDDYWAAVSWTALVLLLIELNAIAARLFRNELADQTWGTLTLVPYSFVSIVWAKLRGAAFGLFPGVVVWIAATLLSNGVQQDWIDTYRHGELACMIVLPMTWLASTSLFSILFASFPPMVLMFCGLLGFFLQWAVAIMLSQMLQVGTAVSMKAFNYGYVSLASTLVVAAFVVAFVRLRMLTSRD